MKKDNICGIYIIRNKVNGMVYVGQSSDIESRFVYHKSRLNRNIHSNKYLQRAWNKYGKENFEFVIIEICDKSKLTEREQYYADKFRESVGIYNFGTFTDNVFRGEKRSNETIIKMSKAQIKNWINNRDIMIAGLEKRRDYYPEMINKNGETISEGYGILELSKILGLKNHCHLSSVINGKRPSVNGWMIKSNAYYDEVDCVWKVKHKNTINHPSFINMYTNEIIPSGDNMAYICKKYGLDVSHLGEVVSGKRKHHKGWILYEQDVL